MFFVFICDAFDFLPGMEVFKSARPENTIYIKVVETPCLTFQIDFLPFMVKSAILCFVFAKNNWCHQFLPVLCQRSFTSFPSAVTDG